MSRHRATDDRDVEFVSGLAFASYEVLERLAAGGMGEVYLCRHRVLNRVDAVKVMHERFAVDPVYRKRFIREAHSAARLRHPHIVTVYTADEEDGVLYLAMEYVEGADLAALLASEGRLSVERTVGLLAPIADALDAAHRQGIVHRDVKPRNILVAGVGGYVEHPYITDFGISKWVGVDDDPLTGAGEFVGTAAYSAPEQLQGALVDGRCDQYGLACIVFECLTGAPPFPRDNQLAIMNAHLSQDVPSVHDRRPGLTADVDPVLARALAKDPTRRFLSCTDLVSALQDSCVPAPRYGGRPAFAPPTTYAPPPDPGRSDSGAWSTVGTVTSAGGSVQPVAVAVIGGPICGDVYPVPAEGLRLDLADGRTVALTPSVDGLRLAADPLTRVNGAPVDPAAPPRMGDSIDVAPTLLQLRSADRPDRDPFAESGLTRTGLDPVEVAYRAAEAAAGGWPPVDPADELVVRVGWRPGMPPGPIAVPLAGVDPLAVRGEPEVTAALVRRIITQLAVAYAPDELCVTAALAPLEQDDWAWLAELPQAASGNPPLSGMHVGSTSRYARALADELQAVVNRRARSAVAWPRVVALLDERLVRPPRDLIGRASARVGVHPILLCGPQAKLPAGIGVHLDLDADGRRLGLHLRRSEIPAQTGVPDGVTTGYARAIVAAVRGS